MTKIREGYKETEIGVIPEDWEVDILSNLSIKIGDGLHGTPKYCDDGGYYFINGNNLKNGLICITDDTKKVDTVEFEKNKVDLRESSILISLNGTIGSLAFYRGEPIILSKSAGYVTLKEDQVKDYIFQVLQTKYVKDFILKELTGTTIRNLSLKTLRNIPVAKGTFPEQQRIAEILSTTDSHIEMLDKTIEDYQLLKKGMMKKLLTEGIGHTEFKETEIGRIPKEWEVVKLSQVADTNIVNSFIDGDWIEKEHLTDSGIRLIQTGNIGIGYFVEKDDKKFIFDNSFTSLNCKEVLPNDILICRMADPTGRSCIVPDLNAKMITSVDCVILRINRSRYDNHFVNHYINSEESLKYSFQNQQGTTRKRITRKKLGDLKLPAPNLEEQVMISSILNEIDRRIELFRDEVKDINELKKSLMEQLLTGRIRTNDSNLEV